MGKAKKDDDDGDKGHGDSKGHIHLVHTVSCYVIHFDNSQMHKNH